MLLTDPPLVVVVDDHHDLRNTLGELLELEGYRVAAAPNGAAAPRYLKGGGCPCIVLLDLTMPVMDGWKFLGELQADAELAVFPVAVMSALDARTVVDVHPQAVACFQKPFDIPALIRAVAGYCRGGWQAT